MIGDYLHQTITLERRQASSVVGGEPTYAAGVQLAARVQHELRAAHDSIGNQVVSSTQLDLEPATVIAPEDRVTVDGQKYRVISVKRQRGLDYESHVLAFLGG